MQPKKRISFLGPKQILERKYDELDFDGDWLKLVGKPAPNFGCIVYCPPKNGKSTVTLNFADYLATSGTSLYFSGEEGFAKTLKDRIQFDALFRAFAQLLGYNPKSPEIDKLIEETNLNINL